MKRKPKRKARKPIVTYPTPVPEFTCAETLPVYTPEPVPVESAKPWYRFGH